MSYSLATGNPVTTCEPTEGINKIVVSHTTTVVRQGNRGSGMQPGTNISRLSHDQVGLIELLDFDNASETEDVDSQSRSTIFFDIGPSM